jgi:hypothetical protein
VNGPPPTRGPKIRSGGSIQKKGVWSGENEGALVWWSGRLRKSIRRRRPVEDGEIDEALNELDTILWEKEMQLKAIRSSWREEWNPFSFEEVSAVGGEIGVDRERTR